MNTTYCELTSLFMLGTGIGQIRRVHKDTIAKSTQKLEKAKAKKTKINTKTSYRPSNKSAKKVEHAKHAESSDDYDSEEDVNEEPEADDNMVSFQVEAPKWADQVVLFVLTSLGWSNPDKDVDEEESSMTGVSSDFKSEHLVALLPTLWTLLNCLETERKEWVFEALMSYFDAAHVQSGTKRVVLQFLSLMIKVCFKKSLLFLVLSIDKCTWLTALFVLLISSNHTHIIPDHSALWCQDRASQLPGGLCPVSPRRNEKNNRRRSLNCPSSSQPAC